MLGVDFKTSVSYLVGAADVTQKVIPPSRPVERTVFVEPPRAANIKRVYAYLCYTRELAPKIVSELINQRKLYQDVRGNCVFVHNDGYGNPVGAELQGTATKNGEHFQGVATGTHNTVFELDYSGGNPKKVFAFESSIDLLSFRQLAPVEKLKDCALVSMGGLKYDSLKPYIDKGVKILSCVDNDDAGREFNAKHGFKFSPLLANEGVKDYNDLLKKRNAEAGIKPAVVRKEAPQTREPRRQPATVKA
jgi:hypothetical protein